MCISSVPDPQFTGQGTETFFQALTGEKGLQSSALSDSLASDGDNPVALFVNIKSDLSIISSCHLYFLIPPTIERPHFGVEWQCSYLFAFCHCNLISHVILSHHSCWHICDHRCDVQGSPYAFIPAKTPAQKVFCISSASSTPTLHVKLALHPTFSVRLLLLCYI